MTGQAEQSTGGTQVSGSVFGWNFAVKGSQAIVIAALLVLVALVIYGAIQLANDVRGTLDQRGVTEITKAIQEQTITQTREHEEIKGAVIGHSVDVKGEHQAVRDAIESLDRTMQEQNFIILMTSEERKNVRLKMPPSLREKLIIGPQKN